MGIKVNKAEERAVLLLFGEVGQVIGFVHLNDNRDRIFYKVNPMDDDDIKQLFNE